jgi:hypothetical protein
MDDQELEDSDVPSEHLDPEWLKGALDEYAEDLKWLRWH